MKFIFSIFLILLPCAYSYCYDLCVVGATSGLGKELIYQASVEKNKKVLALTSQSSNTLNIPYRGDGYQEKPNTKQFMNSNIDIDSYWNHIKDNYKTIIFCTGAKPFQDDYSDKVTSKLLNQLSKKCENIVLISAYGVGDSINNANIGIQVMNNLYLKDVYRAKNEQEYIINTYYNKDNIQKKIYRPKALSYGNTFIGESISRYELARVILNDLNI
jgi:hypothetical protein